jgi:hypothetical protein
MLPLVSSDFCAILYYCLHIVTHSLSVYEVNSELPIVLFKLVIGQQYFLHDVTFSCKIFIQKEAFFLFDTFGAERNMDTAAIL